MKIIYYKYYYYLSFLSLLIFKLILNNKRTYLYFRNNFFPNLLNNIFRLMPVEVLQDNKNKGTKLMEIFSTEPCLDFGGTNI